MLENCVAKTKKNSVVFMCITHSFRRKVKSNLKIANQLSVFTGHNDHRGQSNFQSQKSGFRGGLLVLKNKDLVSRLSSQQVTIFTTRTIERYNHLQTRQNYSLEIYLHPQIHGELEAALQYFRRFHRLRWPEYVVPMGTKENTKKMLPHCPKWVKIYNQPDTIYCNATTALANKAMDKLIRMNWSFKKCLRFTSLGLKRTEKSLYIETQS